MPTGGMLSISTSNCLLTGHERLPGKPEPGRYVLMEICDTGAGIAPEVRPHVFEPFFTTKPRAQATGLGLSTVYGIVKQSDGFIYVESESQQGAKFSIYLPAAEDPKRPAANNTVDIVELLRK